MAVPDPCPVRVVPFALRTPLIELKVMVTEEQVPIVTGAQTSAPLQVTLFPLPDAITAPEPSKQTWEIVALVPDAATVSSLE